MLSVEGDATCGTVERDTTCGTVAWMQDDSDFLKDLYAFIGGKERVLCAALLVECDWLMFCRVNEVSVERLHRVGTYWVATAPHHSANYLPFGLRGPEMQNEHLSVEDMQHWASCCEKLRNPRAVLT